MGYEFSILEHGLPNHQSFTAFNEGVTEKLARELTLDYLDDHPDFIPAEAAKKYREVYEDPDVSKGYDPEIAFVEAMIEKISTYSGLSEQTVWEVIIQGQFSGENFRNSELTKFFDDIFGYSFSDDLASTGRTQDIGALKQYIEDVSPEKLDRFMKAYNLREFKQAA